MDTQQIIQQLKTERARLDSAIAVLQGGSTASVRAGRRGPRHMSPEARKRIAAAQRKRWAKVKGQSAGSAQTTSAASVPQKKARGLSQEARARIAAAQRARWAKVRAQKKK